MNSSAPVPVTGLMKISRAPLRSEVKAIRAPSGDQIGLKSSLGSVVRRMVPPRESRIQMSR